jgi:WD40 repeat protein
MRGPAARAWIVATALLGCGPGSAPPARTARLPASAPASEQCMRAEAMRSDVEVLRAQGLLVQSLRRIDEANALCPAQTPDSWPDQLALLRELGSEDRVDKLLASIPSGEKREQALRALDKTPPPSPSSAQALIRAARTAAARGRAAEARRNFDRALVLLEKKLGSAVVELDPRVEWWTHGAPILATSPHSTILAIAAATQVDLLDAATQEVVAALPVPEGPRVFAFSPDGQTLAIDTQAGVQLWRVDALRAPFDGNPPAPAVIHAEKGRFGSWSPQGNLLLKSKDGLALVSAANHAELLRWRKDIERVVLSPDESVVASVTEGVWSLSRRGEPKPFRVLPGRFESFSPDGSHVFMVRDKKLLMTPTAGKWAVPLTIQVSGVTDWASDRTRFAHITEGHVELFEVGASVTSLGRISKGTTRVHFSREGRTFLAVDGGIVMLDASLQSRQLVGRSVPVTDVAFLEAPKPGLAIGQDTTVWLGNPERVERAEWDDTVDFLAASPDGASLTMAARGGRVGVWNAGNIVRWRASEKEILDLHWVDGSIWTLDAEGVVSRWSTKTHQRTMHWKPASRDSRDTDPDGDDALLGISAILPYGDKLIFNLRNVGVVMKPETEPPIAALDGHADWITVFAAAPGVIASGGLDKTVRIWKDEPGAPTSRPLVAHYDRVTELGFLLGGRVLASAGKDGLVWLWSASGEKLGVLSEGRAAVTGLAVSGDGTRFAVSDGTGVVWLWRVGEDTLSSGKAELLGQLHSVRGTWVFLSQDGRVTLAGDAEDGRRLLCCRLGVVLLPFEVCEGALSDRSSLTNALR